MTKDELKSYTSLHETFLEDCEKVKKHMVMYDEDYNDITDWELSDEQVHGWGDVWSRNCFMGTTSVYFDSELLTYTDNELDLYVDDLIREKQRKKEEKEKALAKEEREKELKEYKRLKKKYGNYCL